MSIYSDLQRVTSGLFAEFKQGTINHIQILSGLGSDDDPGEPSEVSREINATVQGSATKGAQSFIKNGLAMVGDLIVSTGVPAVTFTLKDFIEIDGIRYKIVGILPKPAAGTPVAFTLIVRK